MSTAMTLLRKETNMDLENIKLDVSVPIETLMVAYTAMIRFEKELLKLNTPNSIKFAATVKNHTNVVEAIINEAI